MIENAVAYGERASVSIKIEETIVRIVVEDGGPGIDGAEMDRIFEPFVRLEASRSRKTGVAITRSVARSHGGEIELETRAEGGLRAILSLPRADAKCPVRLLIPLSSAILPVMY